MDEVDESLARMKLFHGRIRSPDLQMNVSGGQFNALTHEIRYIHGLIRQQADLDDAHEANNEQRMIGEDVPR